MRELRERSCSRQADSGLVENQTRSDITGWKNGHGSGYGQVEPNHLCYAETIYLFNGLWEGPDPLNPLISLSLIQLRVSISAIHILNAALKPFNHPPFVTQILGGIILGPSVLGRIAPYRKFIFPTFSFKLLEPMAQLSISFYAFLIGLKMDIRGVFRTGPKQMKIALSETVIPFCVGRVVI